VSFHSGFKMSGESIVIFPEMKNRGISGEINPLFFKTIII